MAKRPLLCSSAMLLGLCALAAGQQSGSRPRFAVVSIVPHSPNFRPMHAGTDQPGPIFPGGKYIDHQTALYELIWFAYPHSTVPDRNLIGLPSWAFSVLASFDFEAEATPGTSPSVGQMRLMMRAVLADRFKLQFHTETRVLTVYFLDLAKGGPRNINESRPGEANVPARLSFGPVMFAVHARADPISDFATKLGAYALSQPVINRTGLTGLYDISVVQKSALPPGTGRGATRSMILLGLRDGLGLKLVSGKVPVPVMVVDHVERPSRN